MSEDKSSFKRRMIRSFFLAFEEVDKKEEEIQEEIEKTGMKYIQMRLPVENITSELEENLRKRVERNILHAKIREADENDLESITHVYNRSWMTSCTPYSLLSVESLKQIYDYPETVILVANVYGTDAGFAILDFEGPNNEFGIIAGLGVIPRFQRKGLGKVIGMASWDYFKKKGVKELRCEVYVDNKASYDFIKSLGFEEYDVKVYKSEDFAS
ncbi:MAG: GNAT family N-acetyltransferase [Promethearchaeota archaeon]|nr:MAG: GNAT family N-acetyltransferase [Candidatus Lokiarchaeota archaeon]